MGTINCKFCGAANDDKNERCFSCNALLPKRSDLSEKDKQSLSNYIMSIEEMLKSAQDKANGKLIPIFITLTIIGILSAVGFHFWLYQENKGLSITLSIIWGLILFIVFGFYVTKFNNQSMTSEFKNKIRFEIKEYLSQMHFTEADFKTTASEVLKKDSNLNKFLPDL